MAAGTMDEGIEASSKRKEQTMRDNLEKLNTELSRGHSILPDNSQMRLDGF